MQYLESACLLLLPYLFNKKAASTPTSICFLKQRVTPKCLINFWQIPTDDLRDSTTPLNSEINYNVFVRTEEKVDKFRVGYLSAGQTPPIGWLHHDHRA